MQRICVGVIVWSFGWSLHAAAPDEVAPATVDATSRVIKEVRVEAREPRYAAPTMRDRIGRVWVPVMINGKGPFRLVLDTSATSSAIVGSVAERLGLPIVATARARLHCLTGPRELALLTTRRRFARDGIEEGGSAVKC